MRFEYESELVAHLEKKKKRCIIVEVVSCESSDFDVTELHIYAADEKTKAFFIANKRYRPMETEHGCVLLPPYRLSYADVVTFGLKKVLFIPMIRQTGITL